MQERGVVSVEGLEATYGSCSTLLQSAEAVCEVQVAMISFFTLSSFFTLPWSESSVQYVYGQTI